MQIKSTSFEHNHDLPARFTAFGEGYNPPLSITGTPKSTQTLLLHMHDPDAVSGDFTHWIVWNIDPLTTEILEDSAPSGSQIGVNDFGERDYGPPAPHQGTGAHRYMFDVYALDAEVPELPVTDVAQLLGFAQKHLVAQASITGIVHAKA